MHLSPFVVKIVAGYTADQYARYNELRKLNVNSAAKAIYICLHGLN